MSGTSTFNLTIPISQFQAELRRVARLVPKLCVEDPLAAIVQIVVKNPAFTQSRLLARLLSALACQHGEFRLAEAAVFDSATLALIVGLMDGLAQGKISESQCRAAVLVSDAAQLSVNA